MKYYKLTCIKDMPEIEAGFTCRMNEEEFNGKCDLFDDDRAREAKMYILRHHKNNKDFVKVEIDLSEAIPNLTCPKCGKVSLFPCASKPYREYDADIYNYYLDVSVECGVCGFKQLISKNFTHSKFA